jgi:hypothetical protein
MARFLAIPFVLAISMGIGLLPLGSGAPSQPPLFFFIATFYLLPVAIFVGALSMTSIGQEGYAVWNIYAAPIKPSQILRAKILFACALGVAFGVALLTIFAFFMNAVAAYYGVMFVIGVLVVLEVSALGVYFAARFPDFREMVRSRYVGVWGSLLGMITAIAVALLTVVPSAVSIVLYTSIAPSFAAVSFLVGVAIFVLASKLAQRQITNLLQNITI